MNTYAVQKATEAKAGVRSIATVTTSTKIQSPYFNG